MSDNIPNWTIFSSYTTFIGLHKFTNDEGTSEYNSVLTFMLDDGTDEEDKSISIMTDHWNSDPRDCIKHTFNCICGLFEDISDMVLINDEEMNIIEEISLDDIITEHLEELGYKVQRIEENTTVH